MGIPVRRVVAGAYALRHYTHVERYTKDLDLFLVREDVPQALELLSRAGYLELEAQVRVLQRTGQSASQIKSLAAGKMGMGTTQVGDLIAGKI